MFAWERDINGKGTNRLHKEPVFLSPEEIGKQKEAIVAFHAIVNRPQSYHIVTYGCQMNAHDSEKLSGILEQMGMRGRGP